MYKAVLVAKEDRVYLRLCHCPRESLVYRGRRHALDYVKHKAEGLSITKVVDIHFSSSLDKGN